MDPVRLRLAALAAPVALGALLGVAAMLEPDEVRLSTAGSLPVTTRATTALLTGVPHTTPSPTPVQARANLAPQPLPTAARTLDGH
ncbi:hypothetical protein [Pseudonocardia sp. ICBG1293]|uniref:hypothetical protein n=1 Tax=Pseudonocardia sp. ICBG1293 TaxID=2844382 RepID=UPI001CD025F3|nr:hypothetical protein [Pseudonocardia sp. ICBG1293]